jgi:hypothetical protein
MQHTRKDFVQRLCSHQRSRRGMLCVCLDTTQDLLCSAMHKQGCAPVHCCACRCCWRCAVRQVGRTKCAGASCSSKCWSSWHVKPAWSTCVITTSWQPAQAAAAVARLCQPAGLRRAAECQPEAAQIQVGQGLRQVLHLLQLAGSWACHLIRQWACCLPQLGMAAACRTARLVGPAAGCG